MLGAWIEPAAAQQGAELASGAVEGAVRITRNLTAQQMKFRLYPSYKPIPPPPPGESRTDEWQNVVVYLEPKGFKVEVPGQSAGLKVRQLGETFIPHVLPVMVGTTVEFPNLDPIFHNVFSLSSTSTFDLGRYPKGESRSVTFDTSGFVPVFCHLHSDMSAVIVVLDTPLFTVPGENGRYALADVPAGDYKLVAWHERSEPVELEVTIEPGQTLELDITVPIEDEAESQD